MSSEDLDVQPNPPSWTARNWPGLSSEVELLSGLVIAGLPSPSAEVGIILSVDTNMKMLPIVGIDAMLVIIGKKGSRVQRMAQIRCFDRSGYDVHATIAPMNRNRP